ncbi:MAG TPA: hypothetical protein VL418_17960 [Devosiaceae bacterium]|nr:hypothetical protein [Devosiaceae bacterium]
MALAEASSDHFAVQRRRGRVFVSGALTILLDRMVAFWIFLGGIVMFEPAPYEFMFALVLPLALFAGMKVYRTTAPLFIITAIFIPFAITAAFQARFTPVTTTLVYELVSIFMLLTAFFAANYVAEAPQERLRRIMAAYTLIAVLSAVAATLGYLHVIPGGYDLLTLYGRAKGLFKDPNVFGPFLIPPALYALQRILLGGKRGLVLNGIIFLALMVGVFASFSRAAWGDLLGGALIVFIASFALEATARQKVRMLILALAGVAAIGVTFAGLLSIPSVAHLFDERASVTQEYDTGTDGRFGRQGYAFGLALTNPLGIGPAEFRNLKIKEEPHDSYATVIHVYGWGGGLCFYALIVLTLLRAFTALRRRSPNRRLLIPLIATYVPLVIEAGIIDIDHWRHYYLVMGLIWGVSSGYLRLKQGEDKVSALI